MVKIKSLRIGKKRNLYVVQGKDIFEKLSLAPIGKMFQKTKFEKLMGAQNLFTSKARAKKVVKEYKARNTRARKLFGR